MTDKPTSEFTFVADAEQSGDVLDSLASFLIGMYENRRPGLAAPAGQAVTETETEPSPEGMHRDVSAAGRAWLERAQKCNEDARELGGNRKR